MLRALTIRFGLMTAGGGLLTIALNLLEPASAIAFFSIVAYTVGASSIIARYCLAHEDEIPVRRRDPDPR